MTKKYKIQLDMDEIKRLYEEELKSADEIAQIMGTYKKMILSRLRDMGVKMRTKGEGKRLFLLNHPEQNPNNMPGVKEKQSKAQLRLLKDENYSQMRKRKRTEGIRSMTKEQKESWKKSMSEAMSNRTPQQKYEAMVKQMDTKRRNGTLNCSGVEDKFEKQLLENNIEYEREYIIPEGNRRYRYDFRVGRKLIEVQGTRTHADPTVFQADDVIDTGLPDWKRMRAKTIWAKDEEKRRYAEQFGYKVEYIWERDLV